MSEEKKQVISDEIKEQLIDVMRNYRKGHIGMLAMSIENIISRVPAPRLAVWLTLELIIESAARHAKQHPNAEIGETEEKAHAVTDLVREHVRSLSDEEFDSFVSEDALNESVNMAMERLKEMAEGHDCAECGACDLGQEQQEQEENPDKLPN